MRQHRLMVFVLLFASCFSVFVFLRQRVDEQQTTQQTVLTTTTTRLSTVSTTHFSTGEKTSFVSLATLQRGQQMTLRVDRDANEQQFPHFAVCSVPRAWRYTDHTAVTVIAVNSWLRAGAASVLLEAIPSEASSIDRSQFVDPKRVHVFGELKNDSFGIPFISSAFQSCDAWAHRTVDGKPIELLVFLNSDIIVPPFFGRVLKAFLRQAQSIPDRPFMMVARRVLVGSNAGAVEKALLELSESQIRSKWPNPPNPHAMDVFVWRRGSWQDVHIPDFLIGRNIWDLFLFSAAVSRKWLTVEGGNALYVYHADHTKPDQQLKEYNENASRSKTVACNNVHCAEYFLYRGVCRPLSEKSTIDDANICLRRKSKTGEMLLAKNQDEMAPLAEFGMTVA